MIYNFKDKDEKIYKNYNFENFSHENALYIYTKILEMKICKECTSIRDIQNIKTKCTEILNKLDEYKTNEN